MKHTRVFLVPIERIGMIHNWLITTAAVNSYTAQKIPATATIQLEVVGTLVTQIALEYALTKKLDELNQMGITDDDDPEHFILARSPWNIILDYDAPGVVNLEWVQETGSVGREWSLRLVAIADAAGVHVSNESFMTLEAIRAFCVDLINRGILSPELLNRAAMNTFRHRGLP
jgi:hypothetical protein